jgi:peptidyl-prolyl cis-trans isomerase SurA
VAPRDHRTSSAWGPRLIHAALVTLWLTASGCASTEHSSRPTEVNDSSIVAVVNGDAITLGELDEAVAAPRADPTPWRPALSQDTSTQDSQSRLIEFRLLLQEAARQQVMVDDAELAQELQGRIERYGLKDQAEFERIIQSHGITLDAVKRRLRDSLRVQKLVRRNVAVGVSVTDDEISRYLTENRDKLEVGLGYRGRQIVLRPDTDTEADWEITRLRATRLRAELASGADFAALARQYSQDVTAASGGDLGAQKRGQLPADIEAQLLRLMPGEMSAPYRSGGRYYVFRLESRESLSDASVQRLHQELREILFRQKYDARLDSWLRGIRERSVIEVRELPGARPGATGRAIEADEETAYFRDIRARVLRFWGYPCIEDTTTRRCDYVATQVIVELRVHHDGRLASVTVLKSSGVALYDDYATDAVKLASPFGAPPHSAQTAGTPASLTMSFTYASDQSVARTSK